MPVAPLYESLLPTPARHEYRLYTSIVILDLRVISDFRWMCDIYLGAVGDQTYLSEVSARSSRVSSPAIRDRGVRFSGLYPVPPPVPR